MGNSWAYLALCNTARGIQLGMYTGTYWNGYDATEQIELIPIEDRECFLKVEIREPGYCNFFYSLEGEDYKSIGVHLKHSPEHGLVPKSACLVSIQIFRKARALLTLTGLDLRIKNF